MPRLWKNSEKQNKKSGKQTVEINAAGHAGRLRTDVDFSFRHSRLAAIEFPPVSVLAFNFNFRFPLSQFLFLIGRFQFFNVFVFVFQFQLVSILVFQFFLAFQLSAFSISVFDLPLSACQHFGFLFCMSPVIQVEKLSKCCRPGALA